MVQFVEQRMVPESCWGFEFIVGRNVDVNKMHTKKMLYSKVTNVTTAVFLRTAVEQKLLIFVKSK